MAQVLLWLLFTIGGGVLIDRLLVVVAGRRRPAADRLAPALAARRR